MVLPLWLWKLVSNSIFGSLEDRSWPEKMQYGLILASEMQQQLMGHSNQTVTYAFVCTHSHDLVIIASLFPCNKVHIGTWYPLHKIKVSCFSELIVASLLASLLCLLVDCCITSCPSLSYFWHSFHNWHNYRQEVSVTLWIVLMAVLNFCCKCLKFTPLLSC